MLKANHHLNLFDTIMIVSGSMIGSGIFIVSADMTRVLGSPFWVLICWIISGVITLFAALSYGELAGMMPDAGGQFIYLKRAYGRLTSFVYGWAVFTVIQTGVIAAVAVAFAKFTAVFFNVFDEKNIIISASGFSISTTQLLGVASILFLTYLNSRGINNGKIIQRVFTSTKIIALSAIILIGCFAAKKYNFWHDNMQLPFNNNSKINGVNTISSFSSLLSALGVALIGALFSSDAWNNVTFIAGEIKNPQKNIPLGLLIGVLIVTILYVLANVAYFILLPALGSDHGNAIIGKGIAHAQNDRVGTAAMGAVFGDVSVYIMAGLIVISTFGCNNGLIMSGARLFQSMAKEGLFFKGAGILNKRNVPSKALWIQAFWSSILCVSGSYSNLLDYCTFASLLFYIVTISAIFYLRKKEPNTHRPYKAFGYPVIPALYIVIAAFICIDLLVFKPKNTFLGIIIISLGIPVYYYFNSKQKLDKIYK